MGRDADFLVCTLYTLAPFELCVGGVFPLRTRMYIQNQPARKQFFCKRFPGEGPGLHPPIPPTRPFHTPPHPRILACVWPSLATAGFRSSRPWSRSELECPARKGAPWRPPEQPQLRVVWGVGAGGSPNRLMRTPNAPQPEPLIASRLAGSGPGPPPPGSINSPSLQMAAGSSLASRFTGDWGDGSRWRTPTPPSQGREAPAATYPCGSVTDIGPDGVVEVEPIFKGARLRPRRGQGLVQGQW